MPDTALDFERYYEFIGWPMRPDQEEARERFEGLRRLFASLIEEGVVRGGRILDAMAGSCIAGAALASELRNEGMDAELVCVDIRKGDLGFAGDWLKIGGAANVPVKALQCDARKLPLCLGGKFRTALIWGSSLPHLSPWELVLVVSGIWELSERDATLLIQQRGFMSSVFLRNDYRHFMMEGSRILSIHKGYDLEEGTVVKAIFEIPGMKHLGDQRVRLWDAASVAAITRIFFSDVRILDLHRDFLTLIIGRGRRERISYRSLVGSAH